MDEVKKLLEQALESTFFPSLEALEAQAQEGGSKLTRYALRFPPIRSDAVIQNAFGSMKLTLEKGKSTGWTWLNAPNADEDLWMVSAEPQMLAKL